MNTNTKATVSVLFLLLLSLTSCSNSKLNCDSAETVDTMLTFVKHRGGDDTARLLRKGAKMEMRNVKTVNVTSNGGCLCEADIYFDVSAIEPNKSERETKTTIPLQYKVYLAPNGKDIRYEIVD